MKKSGRYKPGARAKARSVKQTNIKWQQKLLAETKAANTLEKSAEDKRAVQKHVAKALEAEKILKARFELAEMKMLENQKQSMVVKEQASQAAENSAAKKKALERKLEDEEEAYKRCEARRCLVDKQLQLALTDKKDLQSENQFLKRRLSQLAPAAPSSWFT
jgi:hypothetical protein